MAHLCFRRKVFTVFIGIIALFLAGASRSDAQKGALTTFTGRVIDGAGHPIAGLTVVLMPVADGDGAWFPIELNERARPDDPNSVIWRMTKMAILEKPDKLDGQ